MAAPVQNDQFPTTRHSVILAARSTDPVQRSRAMEAIAAAYWKPIYKYIRLKWNLPQEDAQDFTQEFLLRVVGKELLETFDPAKGRLRTFLRICADRLFLNQVRDAQRQKRNGGHALPLDFEDAERELANIAVPSSPEELYERECVRNLMSLAVERLRAKCESLGKTIHFQLFQDYDLDEVEPAPSYGELAVKYGVAPTDVTNYLAWARRQFRSCVLDQLREFSGSEEEFRREARTILGVDPK